MSEFKAGDTVRLKSGGPLMTIKSADGLDDSILCEWFDKDDKPQVKSFKASSLTADDGGPVIA